MQLFLNIAVHIFWHKFSRDIKVRVKEKEIEQQTSWSKYLLQYRSIEMTVVLYLCMHFDIYHIQHPHTYTWMHAHIDTSEHTGVTRCCQSLLAPVRRLVHFSSFPCFLSGNALLNLSTIIESLTHIWGHASTERSDESDDTHKITVVQHKGAKDSSRWKVRFDGAWFKDFRVSILSLILSYLFILSPLHLVCHS